MAIIVDPDQMLHCAATDLDLFCLFRPVCPNICVIKVHLHQVFDYIYMKHSLMEIDHEIFSTVILSLLLIQEWQLSVSGERMCTILVNHLDD